MWSQSEVAKFHIRDGNESAATEAVNKLLMDFAKHPTLATSICQVGDDDKANKAIDAIITEYKDHRDLPPAVLSFFFFKSSSLISDVKGKRLIISPMINC